MQFHKLINAGNHLVSESAIWYIALGCRRPTPAQLQYGRYFRTVLYTGILQRQHRAEVTLDRIFLLNIEQLLLHLPAAALPTNTGSPRSPTRPHTLDSHADIKLFMCVYSAGDIVWSGNPEEVGLDTSILTSYVARQSTQSSTICSWR